MMRVISVTECGYLSQDAGVRTYYPRRNRENEAVVKKWSETGWFYHLQSLLLPRHQRYCSSVPRLERPRRQSASEPLDWFSFNSFHSCEAIKLGIEHPKGVFVEGISRFFGSWLFVECKIATEWDLKNTMESILPKKTSYPKKRWQKKRTRAEGHIVTRLFRITSSQFWVSFFLSKNEKIV